MLYRRSMHGICLGEDKGTSEEVYNMRGTSIPSWMDGITKLYQGIFDLLSGMPPESRIRHAIHLTPGARPVMKRPYRLSASQKESAEKQILQGLQEGWLQPSTSAWGTAILMMPKKDNTWRMCVDYRDLNALTVADAYPLPRIDDLLHRLRGAKYFTKLDLQSGYHQIWIEPEDRHKTAFRIGEPVNGHCHFKWRVMPFGLKNAPPTFQRYMTLVMNECVDCCLVYMDDLLVYSPTQAAHVEHVKRVFPGTEHSPAEGQEDQVCIRCGECRVLRPCRVTWRYCDGGWQEGSHRQVGASAHLS